MAEFTAGLAAGLTAPLLHTYSGEVFTARRRDFRIVEMWYFSPADPCLYRRERFALLITLIGIFGELVAAVTCYFFSIEVTSVVPS